MRRFAFVLTGILCISGFPGCGLGPRNFRKINHPAPLTRARSISLGFRTPQSTVIPALVGRLDDPDVVVRMAANEELKKRTGQDFGFQPWAAPEERAVVVNRWHDWLSGKSSVVRPSEQSQSQTLSQSRRTLSRPAFGNRSSQ
jgi:hypothetical protein